MNVGDTVTSDSGSELDSDQLAESATDTSVGPAGRSGTDDTSLLIMVLAGLAVGGMAIRRFRPGTEA